MRRTAVAGLLIPILWAGPALAHVAERGLVLLLPTGYYLWGGALAVGASFAALALLNPVWLLRAARARVVLAGPPGQGVSLTVATSLLSFVAMLVLIAAGFLGTRDPLENPLPLAVWTVFWVGLTLAHAVLGNLWDWLNPWTGPLWVLRRLGWRPPVRLPEAVGHWPGILFLFGFTWAELIDAAPDDTDRLAIGVALYWAVTFAAMLLVGEESWRARGECFSIFFRLVSLLAPVGRDRQGRLVLSVPGGRVFDERLQAGLVPFVLLALAAVSFDGLDGTFWWLQLIGVNPLEYPGRSEVMRAGTLGLLGTWAAMLAAFFLAVGIGARVGGSVGGSVGAGRAAGALVVSLIPISLAYHFAHYLTLLLINGQYALVAAGDPFGTGADLLGTGHVHVTTSFLRQLDSVRLIWNAQAAAIVGGHVWAVLIAHAVARDLWPAGRAALAEAPLAVLMVLYTLFGLWLLYAPTGA